MDRMSEVTRILQQIEEGNGVAAEQLLPLVYDELRKLAAAKLAQETPGQTLQATALVHEAYLRLVTPSSSPPSQGGTPSKSAPSQGGTPSKSPPSQGGDTEGMRWKSRGHFFAAAAEAMRRILVEQARRKRSLRQGGARRRCALSDGARVETPMGAEVLDLDEALTKLGSTDPQAAEVVKLRVFAGMTIEEVAEMQGISPRTVKRHWAYARAWLGRELAAYDERHG
jgi:RNA polymerase sigma factor (sigma-70 family)